MKVAKVVTWATALEDKPGGLAARLTPLASAGANLQFTLARRAPERGIRAGVVFVSPIKGARQIRAAVAAGFRQTQNLHLLRVEGTDKSGLAARLVEALAAGRLNLRGMCATAIGNKFVCHIAVDTTADAARAARILRRL